VRAPFQALRHSDVRGAEQHQEDARIHAGLAVGVCVIGEFLDPFLFVSAQSNQRDCHFHSQRQIARDVVVCPNYQLRVLILRGQLEHPLMIVPRSDRAAQ